MSRPISGSTLVAGVIGKPGRRSLSPAIHNAWIEALGLDAVYLPFAAQPDRFGRLVDGLRGGSVRGLNITIPFKEEALSLADRAGPFAAGAGAANLLVFEADGSLSCDNTDGHGLLAALSQAGFSPADGPAAVLGAGGAAKAAVAALVHAGVLEVRVVNRTLERAQDLAARHGAGVQAFGWGDLRAALDGAAAVVNATSLGMEGSAPLDVDLSGIPAAAVVMDMVYRPLVTPLLEQARRRGLRTADGLSMLIAQAAPAFERLFGVAPPPEVDVRAIALAQIGRDG